MTRERDGKYPAYDVTLWNRVIGRFNTRENAELFLDAWKKKRGATEHTEISIKPVRVYHVYLMEDERVCGLTNPSVGICDQ